MGGKGGLTSQLAALLEMVNSFPIIALLQFLADQPVHHAFHPLFFDYRVLRGFQSRCVVVINAVECWGHGRFLGQEGLGLWGGHEGSNCPMQGLVG